MKNPLAQYRGKFKYAPVFLLMFGLIFARYCYYGFEYFLQLDDYIQYHNYTAYWSNMGDLIKQLGLLSSRPLAGLCDLFVWSHFYERMIIAVAIISAMFAYSACAFHKVFSKHFGTGFLFFVIYALLPLGFEGTYWVSASSRIVVGLFFAALALESFDAWCERGKKSALVLFGVFQLAAFCYYEQIVLLSGAATMVVMLCHARKGGKRPLWGFLMFLNAGIYMAVTKLAPAGVYSQRAVLFLPWQEEYWEQCFLPAGAQMKEVFINCNLASVGKGFIRGIKLFLEQPNFLYILIILALCACLFLLAKSAKRYSIRFLPELLAGLFLTIAPLLLFFVLKSPWFGARNAVCSFLGLALIVDALADLIFGRFRSGAVFESALVGILALVCCVSAIAEIHDYRETTLADTAVAQAAAEAMKDEYDQADPQIWLLNVDASYVKDASFYFHEHGYGVTSSDWALTGAVTAIGGRLDYPDVVPVSIYRHFPVAEAEIGKTKAYFYEDGRCFPVSLSKADGGPWSVTDGSGRVWGTLKYQDDGFFLELK